MKSEAHRLKVIGDLKIAGTRGASNFKNILEMAMCVMDAPIAGLTVLDGEKRWFYALKGASIDATPRQNSPCDLVVARGEPVVIEDFQASTLVDTHDLNEISADIRFYAGVPILYQTGVALGALMVLDRKPREITDEQVDLLNRLADVAVDAFRLNDTVMEQQGFMLRMHEKNVEVEQKNAALERAQHDIEVAAELAEIGYWSLDLATNEGEMTPSLRRIFELGDDATAEDFRRLLSDEVRAEFADHFKRCGEGEQGFELRWSMKTNQGVEKWFRSIARTEFERGRAIRVRGCTQNITNSVQTRRHISKLAALDTMTGVHNRRFLPLAYMKLRREMDFAEQKLTMLLIDVDHFKQVNDTKGHDVGDAVLVKISQILRSALRDGDVAGRLGGDEFMLLLRGDNTVDLATVVSKRLAERVKAEPLLQQFSTPVSLSIGHVEITDPSIDFPAALKAADLAVYEAKKRGRACAVSYQSSLGDASKRRDIVLAEVDRALKNGDIVPAYQAKICLQTRRIEGFEALARWRHAERGLLSPGAFIDALEHPFYSGRISDAVLEQVVSDLKDLETRGVAAGKVAVNVTEMQLIDESFPERLESLCAEYSVSLNRLEIELTEKILLARMQDRIKETIKRVSDLGVGVAFDDFGTGYASLTHLRDFDIDLIKIDRSFTCTINEDPTTRAITASVIQMARDLGLGIVAEGVETEEVDSILRDLGCSLGQGFLYSKPIVFEDMAEFIRSWETRHALYLQAS